MNQINQSENLFKNNFKATGFCLIFATRYKKRNELVAQLVEQYTFNVWALGSSPSQFTKAIKKL